MNEINDQFILNYFYTTPNSTKINGHKSLNIPDDIQLYLNNRFDDSESNKETIMRIKYGVEKRPLCPICNKPVRWYGHKADRLFFNTCCHEHEVILRKKNVKNAVNEKYGVDNVFQLNNIKENIKLTCIKKYGVDNPLKSKIIKEKQKIHVYKNMDIKILEEERSKKENTRKLNKTFWQLRRIISSCKTIITIDKIRKIWRSTL